MEKLRSWLRDQDLSQAQLAKRMGVTEGAISQWMNGYCRPTLDNLMELAQQTGLPVESLIEDLPSRSN